MRLEGALGAFRAMLLTAGRPVLQRALVFGTVVAIVSAVLFSRNGMRARDLTRIFHASLYARVALATAWVVLATPIVSCAFDAPGTRTLRALPISRAVWVASLLALLMIVQVPCGALFARGDGLVAGVVAMLFATAIEVGVVAAVRRIRFALLAVVGLVLVGLDLPPLAAALPATALAVVTTGGAWRVALDHANLGIRLTRPTYPVIALAAAHLLRMVRAARARIAVATASVSLGAAVLSLSLQNDPSLHPIPRALAILSLPISICAAVLVVPILETEERVRAVARVTMTRRTTLFAAFVFALATPSSALGATAGAIAGAAAHASALHLGGAAGAWAVPLAAAIAAWGRWHGRKTRRNPALFVVGVVALAVLATGLAASW